ncbi:hypothetical protein NKG05_11310 [Oerskovia sp. M15]
MPSTGRATASCASPSACRCPRATSSPSPSRTVVRRGRVDRAGGDRVGGARDGALVASQPTGAPTWFPCNDVPSDKATYRLSLSTDPSYTVVAGRCVSRTTRGGKTTWVFEREAPTATYLATVQIGRYTGERVLLGSVAGRCTTPGRWPRGCTPTSPICHG